MPSLHRDTSSQAPVPTALKKKQLPGNASFWLVWGFLLTLISPLLGQTRANEFFQPSGSTLTFKTLSERVPYAGCVSVVVEVRNLSNRDAYFDLHFISSSESSYNNSGRISQSTFQRIAAAAGSTHSERFLIPLVPSVRPVPYASNMIMPALSVSYSGSASGTVSFRENYNCDLGNVLLSRSLYTPQSADIDNEWKAQNPGSISGSIRAAAEFDPMQLVADWRTLIGYDVIVMRDSEWMALQRPVQQCVEEWMSQGGHLRIVTPANSNRSAPAELLPQLQKLQNLGTFYPIALQPDGKVEVQSLLRSWKVKDSSPLRISQLLNDFGSTWPLVPFFGQKPMHFYAMITVLAVFALLVGPVNVLWLARAGRRHRLFSTTPLFAALACAILMLMIMLEDGTGGKGTRLQWVQMQPGSTSSYHNVHQEQFCRTGVLLNRSFNLTDDTLLMPVPIAESRWARLTKDNQTNLDLKCHSEKNQWHLGQDYFFSRSEHAHLLLQRKPSRARIERLGSADSITLRSTFDYELAPVFYRDSQHQLHFCARLAPGQTQTLQPCSERDLDEKLQATLGLFSHRAKTQLLVTMQQNDQVIALSQSAPGIETLPSIQWLSTRTIITGPIHASAALPFQP